VLVSRNPYAAYARIAADLHPAPAFEPGVQAGARVAPDGRDRIRMPASRPAPWSRRVRTSARAPTSARTAWSAPGRQVGAGSRLVANVTICHGVRLGVRVLVHPGAVIGADGFGLAREPEGWIKVPQVGGA
jgi:UDP-3-O-[3-hydroxymyristoyl] glucosamine N-acyltransferase